MMKKYHLFFMPSGSECFGHVILEALTVGLPVLISDNTPWKNLTERKAGWDIPITNRNEVIATLKMVQMMSGEKLMAWRMGARNVAREFNSDEKNKIATLKMFERAASCYMLGKNKRKA
jgi:glycosyltransferase involved in cell wall biosynthesis